MVVIDRFWTSGLFVYILDNRPLFGTISLIIVLNRLIVPHIAHWMGIPTGVTYFFDWEKRSLIVQNVLFLFFYFGPSGYLVK